MIEDRDGEAWFEAAASSQHSTRPRKICKYYLQLGGISFASFGGHRRSPRPLSELSWLSRPPLAPRWTGPQAAMRHARSRSSEASFEACGAGVEHGVAQVVLFFWRVWRSIRALEGWCFVLFVAEWLSLEGFGGGRKVPKWLRLRDAKRDVFLCIFVLIFMAAVADPDAESTWEFVSHPGISPEDATNCLSRSSTMSFQWDGSVPSLLIWGDGWVPSGCPV